VSAAHVVGNLGDAARMCFHMMPLSTMSLWPSTVALPWDEVLVINIFFVLKTRLSSVPSTG
jgi:hypothetical protein